MLPAASSQLPTAPKMPQSAPGLPGAAPQTGHAGGWRPSIKLPQLANPAAQIRPTAPAQATAAGIQQTAQKIAFSEQDRSIAAQPTWLLRGLADALDPNTVSWTSQGGPRRSKNANVAALPPTSGLTSVAPPAPGAAIGMPPAGMPPATMGGAAPPPAMVSSPDPMMNGPNPGMPAPGMPAGAPPAPGTPPGAAGAPPGPPPITPPMSEPPPQPLPANPPMNPPRPRTSNDAINDAVLLRGLEGATGPTTMHESEEDMASQMAGMNTKLARALALLNSGFEKSAGRWDALKPMFSAGERYMPRLFGAGTRGAAPLASAGTAMKSAPRLGTSAAPTLGTGLPSRFPGNFTPPPPSMMSRIGSGFGKIPGTEIGKHVLQSGGGALAGGTYNEATGGGGTGSTLGDAAIGAMSFNPYLRRVAPGQFATNPFHAGIVGADAGWLVDRLGENIGLRNTNFARMGSQIGMAGGALRSAGQGARAVTGGRWGTGMRDFGHGMSEAPILGQSKLTGGWMGGIEAPLTSAARRGLYVGGGASAAMGARQVLEGGLNRVNEHVLGSGSGAEHIPGLYDQVEGRANDFVNTKAKQLMLGGTDVEGKPVPGIPDILKDHVRDFMHTEGDQYLSSRYGGIMNDAKSQINNYLQQKGLTGASGQFNPMGGLDRGIASALKHVGLDWAHMHPLQKMMLLGGLAGVGGGALTRNPLMAGLGGASMLGAAAPQMMGVGYGAPPGSPSEWQVPGWYRNQGGQVGQAPPNMPQARNELQAAQGGM